MSRTETGEYRCNWCKANLTRQETSEEHFSLEVGQKSGVASLATLLPGWRLRRTLKPGVYHFCIGTDCLARWVDAVLSESVGDAV